MSVETAVDDYQGPTKPPGGFTQNTHAIRQLVMDKVITHATAYVWAEFKNALCGNQQGVTDNSMEWWGKVCGLNPGTVRRHVTALEKLGMVKVVRRKYKTSKIYALDYPHADRDLRDNRESDDSSDSGTGREKEDSSDRGRANPPIVGAQKARQERTTTKEPKHKEPSAPKRSGDPVRWPTKTEAWKEVKTMLTQHRTPNAVLNHATNNPDEWTHPHIPATLLAIRSTLRNETETTARIAFYDTYPEHADAEPPEHVSVPDTPSEPADSVDDPLIGPDELARGIAEARRRLIHPPTGDTQ